MRHSDGNAKAVGASAVMPEVYERATGCLCYRAPMLRCDGGELAQLIEALRRSEVTWAWMSAPHDFVPANGDAEWYPARGLTTLSYDTAGEFQQALTARNLDDEMRYVEMFAVAGAGTPLSEELLQSWFGDFDAGRTTPLLAAMLQIGDMHVTQVFVPQPEPLPIGRFLDAIGLTRRESWKRSPYRRLRPSFREAFVGDEPVLR